jgi:hypothetical protein
VRFIYVDEAGIAADEPITVVVGLVVHADTQWLPVARLVRELLATKVPEHYQDNFIFHASSIWGNKKFRDRWEYEERLAFLHRMMSIPYENGLGICYGAARRDAAPLTANPLNWPKEKLDHMISFGSCIAAGSKMIRESANFDEIATVVAEDIPEMRERLKIAADTFKQKGFAGLQDAFRITNVVDVVHFAKKYEAPILQLADACAFGIRRFLSDESQGEEFLQSITAGKHKIPKLVDAAQTGGFQKPGWIPAAFTPLQGFSSPPSRSS